MPKVARMDSLTFPGLDTLSAFDYRFLLRQAELDVDGERLEVIERLTPFHHEHVRQMGRSSVTDLRLAEQVHGAEVAVVAADAGLPDGAPISGVDGLVTNVAGVVLGIYVADCCAIYLADPLTGAIGLLHSGRKGSEQGIIKQGLRLMQENYGSRMEDVRVQLSPCIRPPAYEVDFAELIRRDALEMGIRPEHLWDCGLCTSLDLQRFYSYRVEKGRTGRLLALLSRR